MDIKLWVGGIRPLFYRSFGCLFSCGFSLHDDGPRGVGEEGGGRMTGERVTGRIG